jgi:TIR domain
MAKIIVSYRRSDSSASSGRIFDRLVARYGDDSVFMDIDNIPFGTDFREHIKGALAQCDILIAVIGPRWAGASADGKQRIDDAADPVRVEVESALKGGIPVLPVLVDGATMPGDTQLPDGLKELAFINAAPVDMGRDFRQHMERLIRSMDGILAARSGGVPPDPALQAVATEPPKAAPKGASRRPLWASLAALVVIVGGGAVLVPQFLSTKSSPPESTAPRSAPSSQPGEFPPAPAPPPPQFNPTADSKPATAPVAPGSEPSPTPSPAPAPPKTYRVLATVSEGKLNMRGGPGTKYPLVYALPAGTTGISIGKCRMPDDGGAKAWCEANWRTYSGWVSSCCVVDEKTGAFPQ